MNISRYLGFIDLFEVSKISYQNEQENKEVKDEIINKMMTKLRLIFGNDGKPGLH